MNIYLIRQPRHRVDYDTYDAAIVVAESEEAARLMHPDGYASDGSWDDHSWCSPDQVTVEFIAVHPTATIPSVLLASFNAG